MLQVGFCLFNQIVSFKKDRACAHANWQDAVRTGLHGDIQQEDRGDDTGSNWPLLSLEPGLWGVAGVRVVGRL